jgi:hypothetical protein
MSFAKSDERYTWVTHYYNNIMLPDTGIVIAQPYRVLEKSDYDRGYIRKVDLWRLTGGWFRQFDVNVNSFIVEYKVAIHPEVCVLEWEKAGQLQIYN